ncbi:helix-turn-helix domain-containing protein [Agrococcus casei]|uniref:Regulator of polyketide synthase expression n=2 Tax=Agrococcus TaxID=46352 RepID=A0A1R4ERH1_9MICO|nr:helix-turn-helix domain-containing protein [Agrococcus casei]SJM46287.1 Regulator of polyketide synthase expression [Agrococcus casei LMG 22410]
MTSFSPIRPDAGSDAARGWSEILQQLQGEIPMLADEFVDEISDKDWYVQYRIASSDLRTTATETLELHIARLLGAPEPPQSLGHLERLATRRAQQGVPLPSLLRAMRLDFRILLHRLQAIADEAGVTLAADHATLVLDTVEAHIDALRDAYQDAAISLDVHSDEYRSRIVARLFSDDPLTENDIDFISSRLGLRTHANYEVIAAVGDAIPSLMKRYGTDERVFIFQSMHAVVLFREQAVPGKWRREAGGRGGYVGDVSGVAGIPHAVQVALEIAQHVPSKPIIFATERDVWATAARKHMARVFPRHSAHIRNTLQELPESDRSLILECTREYMRTGSVKVTSERLYCHRNTVIKRLKTFFDVTGYDPTVPRDAAWIYISLSS